jgi:hypothetical protein
VPKHLKAHDCRRDACVDWKLLDVERVDREQVAVRPVSRGRRRPDVTSGSGVAFSVIAPAGSFRLSGLPAPAQSSVTAAGMFATAQCQNPLPVGASGSKQVTAKLFVSAGNPDHDSCGETSSPPAPMIPDTWAFGSVSPSRTSVLVTLKAGTSGRNSYGIGGLVEVFMRRSCRIQERFAFGGRTEF